MIPIPEGAFYRLGSQLKNGPPLQGSKICVVATQGDALGWYVLTCGESG
jgi:hypothetical protein